MLPQRPPSKPAEIDEYAVAAHAEWLKSDTTQRVLDQLARENATRLTELLDSFHNLTEAQVKATLQQIKTQRNIITCLTKPLPPQK